jgi:hypothetical protein
MIEIAPRSDNKMTYEEALLYCQFLTHNGHTDWRLPTMAEYSVHEEIYGWFRGRAHQDVHSWVVYPVRGDV